MANLSFISAASMPELIRHASLNHPYKLPLYNAAYKGLIGLCLINREVEYPRKYLEEWNKKSMAVVVGDDDHLSSGPDKFPGIRRLPYWAKRIIVHACAGKSTHYSVVVHAALAFGRAAIIETDTAHEEEWVAAMSGGKLCSILLFSASGSGQQHPIISIRH